MHLGNMKFKQKLRAEQVEADGTESKNPCDDVACTLFKSLTRACGPFPCS